jgi:hypothetical protein
MAYFDQVTLSEHDLWIQVKLLVRSDKLRVEVEAEDEPIREGNQKV